MPKLHQKIGFIGSGNMGQAMIGALIKSGCSDPFNLFVSDIRQDQTSILEKTYGINVLSSNAEVVRACDVIIFAVKPQAIDQMLSKIVSDYDVETSLHKKMFISIAAGTRLKKIEDYLYASLDIDKRKQMPILRVMPNTPALVLAGMSGVCANAYATPEDMQVAKTILSAMGQVIECQEKDMDAVTAMSGSGPAYCFYLVEAMIDAGIKLGIDKQIAADMTIATLKGALVLLENQKESAEDLRKKVTSPGGTTEAAIRVLDDHSVKQIITKAVITAAQRSKALSD
jgi:pyrroline-5-carboxylate reductase